MEAHRGRRAGRPRGRVRTDPRSCRGERRRWAGSSSASRANTRPRSHFPNVTQSLSVPNPSTATESAFVYPSFLGSPPGGTSALGPLSTFEQAEKKRASRRRMKKEVEGRERDVRTRGRLRGLPASRPSLCLARGPVPPSRPRRLRERRVAVQRGLNPTKRWPRWQKANKKKTKKQKKPADAQTIISHHISPAAPTKKTPHLARGASSQKITLHVCPGSSDASYCMRTSPIFF